MTHEVRLILDRRPAASGGFLGLLALATSLLFSPSLGPTSHRRIQSSYRVQDQIINVLDEVEYTKLMVGVGPGSASTAGYRFEPS